MDFQSVLIIIIVAVIAFLTFYVIGIYNKLVNSSNLVNDKWQEIDKLLTNKMQLISKLVEVVKNYAKAEEALFNVILSNKNRVNNAISITTTDPKKAFNPTNIPDDKLFFPNIFICTFFLLILFKILIIKIKIYLLYLWDSRLST